MKAKKRPPGAATLEGRTIHSNGQADTGDRTTARAAPSSGKASSVTQWEQDGQASAGLARDETPGGRPAVRPSEWNIEGLEIVDSLPCLLETTKPKGEAEEGSGTFEELRYHAKKIGNADAKRALVLAENCIEFINQVGICFVGFLTLTFERPTAPKEAGERFNSLTSNLFPELFGRWVRVTEPHKYGRRRGTVHFHLLVEVRQDIRSGVDFKALERRDYRSASPYLRDVWRLLRERLPAYGFGRSELLPLKSTSEGVARYAAKYLSKGRMVRVMDRADGVRDWKGVRLVAYSRGFPRRAYVRFSWAFGAGREWRAFIGAVGQSLGIEDGAGMREVFGKSWAQKVFVARALNPDGTPQDVAEVLRFVARSPRRLA